MSAIHRATQQVLYRLPGELTPLVRSFVGGTRLDWRTCKRREARIIQGYFQAIYTFVQELKVRRESTNYVRISCVGCVILWMCLSSW